MSIICRVKAAIHSGRLNAKDGKKIIEALEKQKPKKPNRNRFPMCPRCGRIFIFKFSGDKNLYCSDCGQLIDWSDAE